MARSNMVGVFDVCMINGIIGKWELNEVQWVVVFMVDMRKITLSIVNKINVVIPVNWFGWIARK